MMSELPAWSVHASSSHPQGRPVITSVQCPGWCLRAHSRCAYWVPRAMKVSGIVPRLSRRSSNRGSASMSASALPALPKTHAQCKAECLTGPHCRIGSAPRERSSRIIGPLPSNHAAYKRLVKPLRAYKG
eukprot:scaffold52207_cov59-Phaeocystis_antarctica.AAC.2